MSIRKIPGCSIIGGKYQLGPLIGKGSFGQVFLGTVQGTDHFYAIKKESQSIKNPQLMSEYKIIKLLEGKVGFPQVEWIGHQNHATFMAMDLLGPNLEDLFHLCGQRFTLKTVLMLADQMLHKLEHFHSINFVHRDIKPENFLMGIQDKTHIVHLADFGLSKRYKDKKNSQHILYKQNRPITGTIRYASLGTHYGIQQSRRDDLEALGFIFVYFLEGSLPWQGVKGAKKQEKYQKIQERKLSVPVEVLCQNLPIEFSTYLNYCRTLRFEEKPDYKFLRKMFRELFDKIGLVWDYKYDWCVLTDRKDLHAPYIRMIVEREGEEISKGRPKVEEVNNSDIKLRVGPSDRSEGGSQNVPSESMLESDLSGGFTMSKEANFNFLDNQRLQYFN